MSIDSSSTSTTYKSSTYFDLQSNTPLRTTLSQNGPFSLSKHSMRKPTDEHQVQQPFHFRAQVKSISDEAPTSPAPDVISTPINLSKLDNKRDKRNSDAKLNVGKFDQQPLEGRHSIAQMPFSSLWSHPFRNAKHQRVNAK